MYKKIIDFYNYAKEKKYTTLAGSLSFFFILSFIPIIYLALSIYNKIINMLNMTMEIPKILEKYVSFDLNAKISILFLITTIYSSSQLFFQLRRVGEIIYKTKKRERAIKQKLLSILISLLFILISSGALIIFRMTKEIITNINYSVVINIFSFLFIYLVLISFIIIVNQYATTIKLHMHQLIYGVIFSVVYITIVSIGYYLYIILISNYEALYGVFSTIIVSFIYIYLMFIGIILGIIINERRITNQRS